MTSRRPAAVDGRNRRRADEGGAVLVLALGILIVLGILVGALAGLAAPSFVHSSVVRNVNDTVATADSGIEYAIQSLKENPHQCSTAQGPEINDRSAQVSCNVLSDSGGISEILLQSTVPIDGPTNSVKSTAIIEINDDTGSPTVMSWRTCTSGGC